MERLTDEQLANRIAYFESIGARGTDYAMMLEVRDLRKIANDIVWASDAVDRYDPDTSDLYTEVQRLRPWTRP